MVWRQVTALENGWNAEASVFNKPLSELAERTEYLKSELDALGVSGEMASVRFRVVLDDPDTNVGAIVCIDPETKKYVRATASMSVFDPFVGSFTCFAVGMLVLNNGDGTGTVAAFGVVDISGGSFLMADMLERKEVFRNGMYYLSSTEPGRITSVPEGPRVQIGVFTRNPQINSDSYGDFAFLSPQYGDISAHLHRTYRMSTDPAGKPVAVDASGGQNPAVRILGYEPDAFRTGDVDKSDVSPYLRVGGEWHTKDNVAYVMWLSSYSSSASPDQSGKPEGGFPDIYLCWTSESEDTGLADRGSVQLSGFFKPVPVGGNGMTVSLEPRTSDYSVVYSAATDDAAKRTWSISMPEYGRGWSPNTVMGTGDFGSGQVNVRGISSRGVTEVRLFVPENLYVMPSDNPSVLSKVEIDSATFQFVDADTPDSDLDEGAIAAPLGGTAYDTFSRLKCLVGKYGRFTVVYDDSAEKVYVGASSVKVGGAALPSVNGTGFGAMSAMVFTQDAENLAAGGYIAFPGVLSPVPLSNGMEAYLDGSSDYSIPVGSSVVLEDMDSGCRGAAYRYNIEMDEALNAAFPPVPAKSGSLVFNGVELESDEFFAKTAVYGIGPDSIYWYNGRETWTPWPSSFTDKEAVLPLALRHRLLFHFVTARYSETGPVTSLRPSEGSPVKVYRCGTTDPATTGDLEIDVDIAAEVYDSNVKGYKAVKSSRNGKLLLGPVVEKIVAGPGIAIDQRSGQPDGQGTVTISATNAAYSGEMDTVALENAKEEMVGMFPYIRLLGWESSGTNIDTGFIAKFQVPRGVADGTYRVRLYASVFGESDFSGGGNGVFAGLTMTYNVLPDWDMDGTSRYMSSLNLKSDLISPDSARQVDVPFGHIVDGKYRYTAFDPILVHNDPTIDDIDDRSAMAFGQSFPAESECGAYMASHAIGSSVLGVRPGYVVAVRISRSAPTRGLEEYVGRIGFMNLRWALVRVEDDDVPEAKASDDCCDVIERLQDVASTITAGTLNTSYDIRNALLAIVDQLR